MPRVSFSHIVEKVISHKYCENSILITYTGKRGHSNLNTVNKYFNQFSILPQTENNIRYKCNMKVTNNVIKIIDYNYFIRMKYFVTHDN